MESEVLPMLNEYVFSNAVKNPYTKTLKKQITINLDSSTVDYFKSLAERYGVPYQTLMNLYLRDCAVNQRQPQISWR